MNTNLKNHPAVLRLAQIQTEQNLNDSSFATAVRLGYSGSTWNRVKNGVYAGDPNKVLARVQHAITRINSPISPSTGQFVIFDHIQDILAALDIARASTNECRLVIFIAPTGGGKSTLVRHLHQQREAAIIEAAPSWRRSYLATLVAIAEQLSIPGNHRTVRQSESAIIQALTITPQLLAIDEGNYFSQDGINFLKLILNRTRCAILLCTLTTDFERMLRESAHEARQLVRRSVAIIRAPAVTARDVHAMQKVAYPQTTLADAAPKIAERANIFGRLDTVARVLREIDPADPNDAPHAIGRALALISTK